MSVFDVNMDATIKLVDRLEILNRSAFPVAVRQTLNDAAFKTKAMVPKVAGQKFTTRQKNFFSAFSTVKKASGYQVNGMVAITGINEAKGDQVAEGLEAQETGGTIDGRKLVPHNQGRISGSYGKKLKTKNRFRNIHIAKKGDKSKGAKHILLKKGGQGTVFEIRRLKTRTKLVPIYIYRRNPKSKVHARPFMRPSAMFAASKLPGFFRDNAEYQFKRALKL